jgi:capsular exopolysaccharide synthesis family protein
LQTEAVPIENSVAEAYSATTFQPEPGIPQPRPSSAYRTEVMQTGASLNPTATSSWLNTPSERILRPHPVPEQRLVALAEPGGSGAEMFRVLSTRLAHMQNKRPLRKLLITSSTGDEGKSVVSANLALTLAQRAGERTLLIEADLRRPNVSALFSSAKLKGITDWVEGKLALDDALYQVGGMPLWVLPAGRSIDEPLPLLESDRFAEMLQTLATAFDWVVIDATPMLPMADATSLSRLSDGVLVVVREGHTRRKVLNKALETIEKNKLLGLVLNEASMLEVGYNRYYEGYGKESSSSKKELDGVKAATA